MWSISAVVGVHVLLYFESFPLLVLLGGIACHGAYAWLLMDFPKAEIFSYKFLLGLVALCADHYIWFQYLHGRPSIVPSALTSIVRKRVEVLRNRQRMKMTRTATLLQKFMGSREKPVAVGTYYIELRPILPCPGCLCAAFGWGEVCLKVYALFLTIHTLACSRKGWQSLTNHNRILPKLTL